MPSTKTSIEELKQKKRILERSWTQEMQSKKIRTEAGLGTTSVNSTTASSTASQSSKNSRIMRRLGTAVGQYVASPVVESMNVNAILKEVDWNEVLDKVDINEVIVDKIDVDRLLTRVDVNRLLDRVDVNKHLNKVDWDAIVERSNLEEIISRSTSGVLTGFASLLRTRLAWVDQWGQRIGRRFCCRNEPQDQHQEQREKKRQNMAEGEDFLPPRPGLPEDSQTIWKNPRSLNKREFEKAIQFRTCGATNRLLYLAFDQFILWFGFAVIAAVIAKLTEVFTNDPHWWANNLSQFATAWVEGLLYASFSSLYWIFLVGCFGRTIGMSLLGLLMVSENGNRISLQQVLCQVFLIPLNLMIFGWVLGYTRRDGAFVSDWLGGVRVVYAWGTRNLPEHHNHPEIAMSVGDFVDAFSDHERKALLVPQSLDVKLGGDDYHRKDDDEGYDDFLSLGNESGADIEITGVTRWVTEEESIGMETTNLEDGASRWSKENI